MKVGRADIFFTLGFPFEQRVVSKLTSGSTVIEVFAADNGVQRRHLESHTFAEKESHQEHGMRDPHVWLGPPQLKTLAENTFEGLTTVAPEHREDFAENLDRFLEQLEQVDSEIAAALQGYKGKKILVFHPAFGYFCDHYEIQQVPIEIEGKSPSPKQIEQIIKQARKDNIRILFVQPQFDRKSAEKIAEVIDGAVVSLNPLHEDVLENLREIAEKIQPALR
jgi:zinc transport system substrate-binding protein